MLRGELALTATRPTPPSTGVPAGDLARGRAVTASSHTQVYAAPNAVDGDPGTYWESANHAFPQWIQADLGAGVPVGRVVLRLPGHWERRTQTLSITGSRDGTTFTTLLAATGRDFDPGAGNQVVVTFPATAVRHLRVLVTANTAWPAAQLSTLEAYAG
jgi:hypothetical protein